MRYESAAVLLFSDIHHTRNPLERKPYFPELATVKQTLLEKILYIQTTQPGRPILLVGLGDYTNSGSREEIDDVIDIFRNVQALNVPIVLTFGNRDPRSHEEAYFREKLAELATNAERKKKKKPDSMKGITLLGDPEHMVHTQRFSDGRALVLVGFSGYPEEKFEASIKDKYPKPVNTDGALHTIIDTQMEVIRQMTQPFSKALQKANTIATAEKTNILVFGHYPLSMTTVRGDIPPEVLGDDPLALEAFGAEMDKYPAVFAGAHGHAHKPHKAIGLAEGQTPNGTVIYNTSWVVRENAGKPPILQLDIPLRRLAKAA